MFTKSARFYDAIYSFKDYSQEALQLREAIDSHKRSKGRSLLDVACGTGKHLKEFSRWYEVEGIDLDANLLASARSRLPGIPLHHGDMRTFELEKRFDAVTCLFSSIGYMQVEADMRKAMSNLARHLKPGGVMLVEPWLYRDHYQSPHLHMLTVDDDNLKIARMSNGKRQGDVSIIDFEYLIMTFEETIRESERHEMGLYSQEEYESAMRNAGLEVDYDPIGPMGRGLFLGVAAS
jgi:ubiquinone/menaquinone biosynthesis C-methylase UbiE